MPPPAHPERGCNPDIRHIRQKRPGQSIRDFLDGDYPPAPPDREADGAERLAEVLTPERAALVEHLIASLGLAAETKRLCGPALPQGDLVTLACAYFASQSPHTITAQRVEGLKQALIVLCVYDQTLLRARMLWAWVRLLGVPSDQYKAVRAAQGKSQASFHLAAAEAAREILAASAA